MTPYAKASDQYLVQRVMGATPEQLMAILLEGAQRFLAQAAQAMDRRDFVAKAHGLNKASAIVDEMVLRLDLEQGSELAQNLLRLYDWWSREIVDAGAKLDRERLDRVSRQMGDLRQSWEQSHSKRQGAAPGQSPVADLVG